MERLHTEKNTSASFYQPVSLQSVDGQRETDGKPTERGVKSLQEPLTAVLPGAAGSKGTGTCLLWALSAPSQLESPYCQVPFPHAH